MSDEAEELETPETTIKPCPECEAMMAKVGMVSAAVGVVVGLVVAVAVIKAS